MVIRKENTKQVEALSTPTTVGSSKKHFFMGIGSFALALCLAIILIVSGKSTKATAGENSIMTVNAPEAVVTSTSIDPNTGSSIDSFGIPVTQVKNTPVSSTGISRNAEVTLTDKQAEVVKAFDGFLENIGKYAIVTSGKRSSESQLEIIKERIDEKGASAKFPELEDATMADTSVWMKAWKWLAARHVPVNAPAAVPGQALKVSKHLQGKAIDFIAGNLDQLYSWLAKFRSSKFAQQSDLKIAGIVREPYCVHIDLG